MRGLLLCCNNRKMKTGLLICLLFVLFGVKAQESARKGWFIGAGAGVSHLDFNVNWTDPMRQNGLTMPNIQVGKMLTDHSAFMLYLPGTIYRYKHYGRERDRGFEGIIPTYQQWITKRWWAMVGLGLGMDAPAFYDIENESERKFYFGPSVLAATGFEMIRKDRFSLDLSARYTWSSINTKAGDLVSYSRFRGYSVAVLVGARFYLQKPQTDR